MFPELMEADLWQQLLLNRKKTTGFAVSKTGGNTLSDNQQTAQIYR